MIAMVMMGSGILYSELPEAEAAKVRHCTTNAQPRGVEVTSSVWVAIDGGASSGSVQRFSTTSCTVTTYTSGIAGSPHFIDAPSTTKVVFTEKDELTKIGYLNPDTGSTTECSNVNINAPDDIDSWVASDQYFTSYNNGKVVKSVFSNNQCTFTFFTLPNPSGITPNPEGIDRSSDVNGFFVVDQANKRLYKFDVSTGGFTLCRSFTGALDVPFFVAVNDAQDILIVTFLQAKVVRGIGTLSCAVAETSIQAGGNVYDVAIAGDGADPYVTYNDQAIVARYDWSTDVWTPHDWSAECSSCTGFGIDAIISNNTYYAAMRGATSKLVVGQI